MRTRARFVAAAVTVLIGLGLATPAAVEAAPDYTISAGTDTLSTTVAKLRVGGLGETVSLVDIVDFTGCAAGDTQVSRGRITGFPSSQFAGAIGTTTTTVTALCLRSIQTFDLGSGPQNLYATLQTARSAAEQAAFGPGLPSLGALTVRFVPSGLGGSFESTLVVNYDVRRGSATGPIVGPGSTGPFSTAAGGPPPSWARASQGGVPTPFCHDNPGGAHLHCVYPVSYPSDDEFVPGVPAPSDAGTTPSGAAAVVFVGAAEVNPGLGYPLPGGTGSTGTWSFDFATAVGVSNTPNVGTVSGGAAGELEAGIVQEAVAFGPLAYLATGGFCGLSGGVDGSGIVTLDGVNGSENIALSNVGWAQSFATVIVFDGDTPSGDVFGVVTALPTTGSCASGTATGFTIVGAALATY